jgi:hypothetical protein
MDPDRKKATLEQEDKSDAIHFFTPVLEGLYVTFHRTDERRQHGNSELK